MLIFYKEAFMSTIKEALLRKLEAHGVEPCLVPGFMRTLSNALNASASRDLLQINQQLEYLGWHSFELDYHTLQLAMTCLETDGREAFEYKPARWFESKFDPQKAA
jgi:hypothetical protein